MKSPIRARAVPLAALLALSTAAGAQVIGVEVNGSPVTFYGMQPQQINGRVMVPLRGVLERMGALVEWNPDTQTVIATRGHETIRLPVGSDVATVDGRSVPLDVPARVINGATMVPLRFVSESLGASVAWDDRTRTALIDTDSNAMPLDRATSLDTIDRPQGRAHRTFGAGYTLDAGTVIPVTLDTPLSSDSNRSGDPFTATVRAGDEDAGLPAGTRVEGVVREAVPAEGGQPGTLDLDVRRVVYPDGRSQSISGSLISLQSSSIQRNADGLLVAKSPNRNAERNKFIGIGAAGGLIIGALTRNNTIASALLGAGLGYLYSQSQNQKPGNVRLGAGSEFGIRLDRPLRAANR